MQVSEQVGGSQLSFDLHFVNSTSETAAKTVSNQIVNYIACLPEHSAYRRDSANASFS